MTEQSTRPAAWQDYHKHNGAIAEFIACEWLSRNGYEVFRNMSQHGIADFVAWKPGQEPILYDVKSVPFVRVDGVAVRINPTKPSAAQKQAGVRLLFVNRDNRRVSENLSDFQQDTSPLPSKPRPSPEAKAKAKKAWQDTIHDRRAAYAARIAARAAT